MNKRQKTFRGKSLYQEIWQLLGYLTQRRRTQLGLLLILMVISSFSEVVSLGAVVPFLGALSNAEKILSNNQWEPVLTRLNIETPNSLVTTLTGVFILTIVIANGLRLLTLNFQTHLGASISSDISCLLYKKTLLQPYSFHFQHNSSDLIELVTGDTRKLTYFIFFPLLGFATNSLVALALVGGLILIDARVAFIATLLLGTAYTVIYKLRRKLLDRNSRILVQSSQRQIKVVQEGLGGIRDVLIGGSQNFFQTAYKASDIPFRHAAASTQVISQTPRYIIETLAVAAIGFLALGLGQDGDFSQAIPILGSLALGANRLLPVVQSLFGSIVQIQGARESLRRILNGLHLNVDPLQDWVPEQRLNLESNLQFSNIWFRYSENDDWVLKDLNLEISAKTTVAFVGSTGSGKSTTVDLLLGLIKPQKGMILVNGESLECERLRCWQKSVAHVPQNIFLADSTIAENIAFGVAKEKINFEQVRKAAKLAQIDDYIQQLPARYETYVGERGVRLSGGQRQRIGIARALYTNASTIVFDEATSALDNATEKEVMESINNLSSQFTIILIAHRLSTVENCDMIFELQHGKLIAQGTYRELLTSSSSFNAMVKGIRC